METNSAAELFTVLQLLFAAAVIGLLAVGVTIRLAVKPIVDAIIRLREAFPARAAGNPAMAALRREVQLLRAQLERLRERQAFDSELLSGTPVAALERASESERIGARSTCAPHAEEGKEAWGKEPTLA